MILLIIRKFQIKLFFIYHRHTFCINIGAGLTGGASSNANSAAASLAALNGLSSTNGVNMLALQHLFAGSPLTTGLPASGLTNSVSGKFYIFMGKTIKEYIMVLM